MVKHTVTLKKSPLKKPIMPQVIAAKKQTPPASPSRPSIRLIAFVTTRIASAKSGIPNHVKSTGPNNGMETVLIVCPPSTRMTTPKTWPRSFLFQPRGALSSRTPRRRIHVDPRKRESIWRFSGWPTWSFPIITIE